MQIYGSSERTSDDWQKEVKVELRSMNQYENKSPAGDG